MNVWQSVQGFFVPTKHSNPSNFGDSFEKRTASSLKPKIFHMQSVVASQGNLKCQYLYLLPLYIYALEAMILKATSKEQRDQQMSNRKRVCL